MESFESKVTRLKQAFSGCHSREDKYNTIIALGRAAPRLDERDRIERNRVDGCQSTLYLKSEAHDGRIYYRAESNALISSGLSYVLTSVYSGQPLETVLKQAPTFLEELDIPASLSPSRANGLASLFIRMKQDALGFLVDSMKKRAPSKEAS